MKPKKIFTTLNKIDDDMIEDADLHIEAGSKKRITPVYRQMAALCAALVLLITGGVWFVTSPLFKDPVPDIITSEYSIRGIIMQVGDGVVLIKVTDGWIVNSSDLITVPVDTGKLHCEVGMRITFYYDGMVMESYPAQIETPSEITLGESDLPMFGEIYDFENYIFYSACEEYYVDTVENGIGHTETVKNDYDFPKARDGFNMVMKELLSAAKLLKNVGYHDYFFNNSTTRVAVLTSIDGYVSSAFDIVVEERGWLKINADMFFIGAEKASAFMEYIRENGIITDELSANKPIDYISYNPISFDLNTATDTRIYMVDVLEKGDKILFLWCNDYQSFWVEMFDINTNETEVVWEYSYPDDWFSQYFRLESADYGEFDYRIVGREKVFYKSSADPLASEIFETPLGLPSVDNQESLLIYSKTSFDIYPQEGIIAYSNADGVYIQKNDSVSKILDSNDLVDSSNSVKPENMYSFYGNVHFLNEGNQLAATIIAPSSQSDIIEFALVDIDTGEVTLYEDVFSAMVAEVDYVDDNTVALWAIDRFTLVNAEDKTTEVFPWDLDTTFDYKTFVNFNQDRVVNGVKATALTSFTLDNPSDKKMLFIASDNNVEQYSVTTNFVICLLKSKSDSHFAILNLY